MANALHATHNRAGEITYRQIGPLTIEMTITTYTRASSTAADRDSLEVDWGDGTREIVQRTGNGTILPNDVKKNEYTATHTYPGRSTYTVSFTDPNRVANILNVDFPNSVDVPFYLATTFTLLNTQFQGFNSSAQLLEPPLDVACVGQPFVHNPNAFDPDGDSLAYELITPLMENGVPVPNYRFPNQVLPGPDNIAGLNSVTGDFVWNSPPQEGEYNIAIRINEYRKGVRINSIIRDMQIKVIKCNNRPPEIEAPIELCVVAGEAVSFDIGVNDPDEGQLVNLTATGGPFVEQLNPAAITNNGEYLEKPFTSTFTWITDCNDVSKEYYQVVLKATDNYFADTSGLATFKTVRIKVVAPPPEEMKAESVNQAISVEWALPYQCEVTLNNFFQGFSVWRKTSPSPIPIDSCTTGIENFGYEEIVFLTKQNDGVNYFIIDDQVEKGVTYCYRVQAEFASVTPSGSLFNRVESLPSAEVCLQVSRDLPLITKTSIERTSVSDGQVHIRWTKPLLSELDTSENKPPYRIEILRSIANQNVFQVLPQSVLQFDDIVGLIDTNFFDNTANTLVNQYDYNIAFYTNGNSTDPLGSTAEASTIFLNHTSSDKRITISWEYDTPWTNYSYDVYREDENGVFRYLNTTEELSYLDLNLENEKEYCYFIEATGSYNIEGVEDPIVNKSQILCAIPIDDVAPCAPNLEISNICDDIEGATSVEDLFNTLFWNDPNMFCDRREPIDSYRIYYKTSRQDEYELIHEQDGNLFTSYEHSPEVGSISGCYVVTALDALGNESEFSNEICIDNCPLYELPNTFTPNGDNSNDIFKPTRSLFVDRVDFKVYNEWGNLVFETTDPAINWNGQINGSGAELHPATYYYKCIYFTSSSTDSSVAAEPLSGFIQLIR